ncbi:rho guanine nucleotide exchange factor 7-like isoform X2 [Photinus pyralis]|nr:rho guanine nucleotide exchange factor 7-like isoform X2 [Photinus pyralis]
MSPLVAAQGLSSGNNRPGTGTSSISGYSALFPSNYNAVGNRGWSASCLRPAPPLRPCLALGTASNGSPIRSNRKPTTYAEDALILDVIEAYCSNGKSKNTIPSVELLTGGNVQMHDKLARSNLHRSSVDLGRSSSAVITQPLHRRSFRPHVRASTWCCGSLIMKRVKHSI